MLWFQWWPTWRLLTLPLWLASLNVQYLDFRYVVPFLVQFGLYLSPVGFSSAIVPEKWQLLYSLNPMVGVIEGFRWTINRKRNAAPTARGLSSTPRASGCRWASWRCWRSRACASSGAWRSALRM
jgi:ABC-type polysaccharide/polyol phosphate export permease